MAERRGKFKVQKAEQRGFWDLQIQGCKVAGGDMGKMGGGERRPGCQWSQIKRGLSKGFGINSFLFLICVYN